MALICKFKDIPASWSSSDIAKRKRILLNAPTVESVTVVNESGKRRFKVCYRTSAGPAISEVNEIAGQCWESQVVPEDWDQQDIKDWIIATSNEPGTSSVVVVLEEGNLCFKVCIDT